MTETDTVISETPSFNPVRAWIVTILLSLMMLVNFLDKVVLGLVSVPMMRDLHLSSTEFGVIGGSLNWLFSISAVIGGIVANRTSTKPLLLLMGAAWAILQLPMLFAGSLWGVLVCRVLLGASEGPASPVSVHALYKWFPDKKRNLPVAVLFQGSSLGLLIAGLCIPVISTHWGWRANFLALAALGIFWCIAWLLFGAEGRLTTRARVTSEARVPYAILLTDRTILGTFAGHFAANWILAMTLTWTPRWLQLGMGYDAHAAGRIFALFVAVTAPMSLGLATLSQRMLERGVPSRIGRGAFVAVALMLAGTLLAALKLFDPPPVVKCVLLTLGGGMTLAMYSIGPAILGEVTPDTQRGGILALSNGFSSLAGLAAPVVTGMLIDQAGGATAHGFESASLASGIVLLACGGLCACWLDPQRSATRIACGVTATKVSHTIAAPD
ncbi:MFS transporter [Paraburkholderia sp. A3BS-1L]|uniref:MFS transporter n=1 Tax=Paraburkholderia sp. A3BS-1L TaxID=3028375 RepID=UPI003DAA2280